MPRRVTRPSEPAPEQTVPELSKQVQTLLAEAQALSARLATLHEIAIVMRDHVSADEILAVVAHQAHWIIDFDMCSIAWCDEQGYSLQVLQRLGAPSPPEWRPLGQGAVGRALAQRHAILVREADAADDLPDEMGSALIMPLINGGVLIGSLNFIARAPLRYTFDDLRIASALATQVASLLQNVRLFGETVRARDELHTVLESISDAVLVIDTQRTVRLANTAAARMLGRDICALQGHDLADLAQEIDGAGATMGAMQPVLAALEAGERRGAGMLYLHDGRALEWILAPLAAHGQAERLVLTLRDVSDRLALGQLRDDMIHMLVHDLRTPLTGLMLALDLVELAIGMDDATTRDEMLQQARRAAGQLLDQSNLILEVRRLEAGRLPLERAPLDLAELLAEVSASFLVLAARAGLVFEQAIGPRLPRISADRELIRRVLENLLGNALKFTPAGSRVRVGAGMAAQPGQVQVWVEDSGPGIPAELRAAIFEKFTQADTAAQRKGSGLGLAFCKLAVEAHGGTIGVDPAAAGGSRFWFCLAALEA